MALEEIDITVSGVLSATTVSADIVFIGGNSISPSSATFNTLSATTLSASTLYSGSTDLYYIFAPTGYPGDITRAQPGSNITTGGTGNNPIINLVDSPSVNNFLFSGTALGNSFSAYTISGGTFFSGSTSLETIISRFNDGNDITRVQPGYGILTGGTQNTPIINVNPNLMLVTFSGGTVSGGTIYSGATELGVIIQRFADGNDITRVQPGTNILTGGTDNFPIISTQSSPQFNNGNFSGTTSGFNLIYQTISGGTVSGGTIYSGATELGVIIQRFISADQNDITRVQPGNNITTGGTDNFPVVNLVASPFVNNFNMSGTGTFNIINSATISGSTGNITNISSSSILSNVFSGTTGAFTTLWSNTANLATITGTTGNITNILSNTIRASSFSGTSLTATTITGTSVYGGTLYSGSTELGVVMQRFAGSTGGVTNVGQGSNITTGGTAASPIISLIASPSINALNISGLTTSTSDATFNRLSGASMFVGGATGGTLQANLELVLQQTGDTFGPSILRLRNRNGENGAIYETTDPTITLVDFIFKTAINQRNIRYEARTTDAFLTAPEFEFGQAANPTLVVNDTTALIRGSGGLRSTSLSATTISGGTIYSGSTELGVVMQRFVGNTGGVTNIGQGLNITTGGTAAFPIINVSSSVQIPTISGTSGNFTTLWSPTGNISSVSGTTGSLNTLFSATANIATITGTTGNITNIRSNSILSNTFSGTNGSFTTLWSTTANLSTATGTTATFTTGSIPTLWSTIANLSTITGTTGNIINLNSNSITSSSFSGTSLTATTVTGTSVYGGTIYSGGTDLYSLFMPAGSTLTIQSGTTLIQNGTNTYTGGTSSSPTVNVSALTISTIVASGTSRFISLSATTFSGGTIYSGTTDLSLLFVPVGFPKFDFQTSSTGNTVTATVNADIPGMTLTAKNLGSSSTTYQIKFDANLSNSNNAGNSSVQILLNSTRINTSLRTISNGGAAMNAASLSVCSSCSVTGVTNGDTIKVQFSASTGTVTITNRTLSIIGMLNTNIL